MSGVDCCPLCGEPRHEQMPEEIPTCSCLSDAERERNPTIEWAPCAECGRAVFYDPAEEWYRHTTGPACALALAAPDYEEAE